jgi:hypothetical protein
MITEFTPLHLTLLIEAYTGSPSTVPDTPTKREFIYDLIKQGLVYQEWSTLYITEYGKRKVREILLLLQSLGEEK